MIIVRLSGGLGNQMFQYAAARRLAEHHSTILKLDVSGFETYKLHRYSLHCFHIWDYLATQEEIESVKGPRIDPVTKFFLMTGRKMGVTKTLEIMKQWGVAIREPHFHFDPNLLTATNNIYLDGYWQSEKYFADIKEVLLREFTIKYPQDAISQEISKTILTSQSVSLHIRRGDYITDRTTHQFHGVCSLDYYKRAVSHVLQGMSRPHLFIFSDEPQWARDNLKLDFPTTVIEHNGPSRNYEDLRLMSQCKHNIIANSSLSWWGAWLNLNPEKIVIAPQKWFADDSIDTKDLIPEGWIKV